jgi:hypothetical protein
MPIPKLRKDGWLPVGIHDCTIEEIEKHFGRFKRTDRRIQLFDKLVDLVRNAWQTGFVKEFFIDGSFTSAKDEPGDIDLIIVLDSKTYLDPKNELTFADELALDKERLRKRYKFDVYSDVESTEDYHVHLDTYQKIRDTNVRKGILRLRL